jgi:hypothetical protein
MVSRFRHSLSDDSVCAGTVVSSYKDHDLIPEAKIIDMFKSRGSRWRVEAEGLGRSQGKGKEVTDVRDSEYDSN